MDSQVPSVDDSAKEVGRKKRERGKAKPRHKFTKQELQILTQLFEQNPYPDFSTRKELANQMHCHIFVINNFFQNKRARLQPRDEQRLKDSRRQQEFPLHEHWIEDHQDAQMTSHDSASAQSSSMQQTPQDRIGYFPKETQGLSREEDKSCDSVSPGSEIEPRHGFECQEYTGSGPSPSCRADIYSLPTSSLQCFDMATFSTEESQPSRPLLLHHVGSVQGQMQQQEEQELPCQYSLYEGQQQNDWGYYVHQLPQPQQYSDMLQSQDPFLVPQRQEDLEQQVPSLLQELDAWFEANMEALSSQRHCSPVLQMVFSSLPDPLRQDGQRYAPEKSRFPAPQLCEEGSAEVHDWASILAEAFGFTD